MIRNCRLADPCRFAWPIPAARTSVADFAAGEPGTWRKVTELVQLEAIPYPIGKLQSAESYRAQEILVINKGISAMIRDGKTFQIESAMQVGKKFGMVLLNEALESLVENDLVACMEAYMKCVDKEDLFNKLKQLKMKIKPDRQKEFNEEFKAVENLHAMDG